MPKMIRENGKVKFEKSFKCSLQYNTSDYYINKKNTLTF